jgi:hypothetical protein
MTLPISIRKALKIGSANRRVRFELCDDGSARLYAVPDATSVRGALHDAARPYDPAESQKAFAAIARKAAKARGK